MGGNLPLEKESTLHGISPITVSELPGESKFYTILCMRKGLEKEEEKGGMRERRR